MNQDEFKNFFEPYAKNVDNAKHLGFWRLSDALIAAIIKDVIPNAENQVILDAGGGTGRWVCELAAVFKGKFVLYDLSEDMLRQARKNIAQADIKDKVTVIHGSMEDMGVIESNSIDHVVSIYSPISFVADPLLALKELHRIVKPGGKVLVMGHGYYNALFSKINNYIASPEEIKTMEEKHEVKWADYVPTLHTFSKERMEKLLQSAGFSAEKTYGVPVFVQPGPEDFDPENKLKSRISQALEEESFFKEIFETEMKHNAKDTVANRGVNIFSVGIKD